MYARTAHPSGFLAGVFLQVLNNNDLPSASASPISIDLKKPKSKVRP